VIEGIGDDAQMISARPEAPFHVIRVNKSKLQHADYIIATQCLFLLRIWSNPARIPVFTPAPDKVKYAIGRAATMKPLNQFPAQIAEKTAIQLVQGILHQLRSAPMEIAAIADCWNGYEELRQNQTHAVESHLKVLSQGLAPNIRAMAPDDIWRKNATMNAAYALKWSRLCDSRVAFIPYESVGLAGEAEKLLSLVPAEKTSAAYVAAVDAWAERFSMRTSYTWEYRSGK
jgi:hypothetical protein